MSFAVVGLARSDLILSSIFVRRLEDRNERSSRASPPRASDKRLGQTMPTVPGSWSKSADNFDESIVPARWEWKDGKLGYVREASAKQPPCSPKANMERAEGKRGGKSAKGCFCV